MSITERIALWFATTGANYNDQEVRELLNDADDEIDRLRGDLAHEKVQLLSAVRALEMFVQEFDNADGTTLEPTCELIDLARFHVRTNGEAARAAGEEI